MGGESTRFSCGHDRRLDRATKNALKRSGYRTSSSGEPFMSTRTRRARRSNGARDESAPTPPETNKLVVCRANGHFTMKVNPDHISEIIKQKDQFVWLD